MKGFLKNFFTWEMYNSRSTAKILWYKILSTDGSFYGVVYEVLKERVMTLEPPVFSLDSECRDEVVESSVEKVCCSFILTEKDKEDCSTKTRTFSLVSTEGKSFMECLDTMEVSGFRSKEENTLITSVILACRNPGILPVEIHELESLEDFWAEADYLVNRDEPDYFPPVDEPDYFPLGKEPEVTAEVDTQNLPGGKEYSPFDLDTGPFETDETSPVSDNTEELRFGLAEAIGFEKFFDGLYGNEEYLLKAIALDILEGRLDAGVDIRKMTREEILVTLEKLAAGVKV